MSYVDDILRQFEVWVGRAEGMPAWTNLCFVDATSVEYDAPTPRVPRRAIVTLEEFRPVFEAMLGEGYPWLNLVALGVAGVTLVVAVEKSKGFRTPGIRTAINFAEPQASNTARCVELVPDAAC